MAVKSRTTTRVRPYDDTNDTAWQAQSAIVGEYPRGRPAPEGVVPYPPEFAARYRAKGYWEDRPMVAFFDEIVTQFADRVAFVTEGERITYRELAQKVEWLALSLPAVRSSSQK